MLNNLLLQPAQPYFGKKKDRMGVYPIAAPTYANKILRIDAHVHIDKIDLTGNKHKTQAPSSAQLISYVLNHGVKGIYAIYESDGALQRVQNDLQNTGTDVVPIYWERHPQSPNIPKNAKGIKLHPKLDRYQLILQNIRPVLEQALDKKEKPFIYVHTECTRSDMEKWNDRPNSLIPMIEAYPQLNFVICHAGTFMPVGWRRIQKSKPKAYKDLINLSAELVQEAADLACKYKNVYLETSIIRTPKKAQILAKLFKEAPYQIIIGTDFPINTVVSNTVNFQALSTQEEHLLKAGLQLEDIAQIHQNAKNLAGLIK